MFVSSLSLRKFTRSSLACALLALGWTSGSSPAAAGAPATTCDAVSWDDTDTIWTAHDDGSYRSPISSVSPGDDPTLNLGPRWSPDGERLAWVGNDADTRQIWVANADGTSRTKIPTVGADPDPTSNSGPQWSPDGTQLAWAGGVGGSWHIWTANADGTSRTNISTVGSDPDPTRNAGPQWSPDGTQLAWAGYDGATRQIWTANADGTDRAEVSTVGSDPDPTANIGVQWSPDGERLSWAGHDGTTLQIWTANADGSERTKISTAGADPDPALNFGVQWSPDGERLAWAGHDGATSQIWTANADGTDRAEISTIDTDPTVNFGPQWAPDGERLTWSGYDGTTWQVWTANADGSKRTKISDVGADPDPVDNVRPTWRPRVGHLTMTADHSEFVVGQVASATISITSTCPHGDVTVGGLDALDCLESSSIEFSQGTGDFDGWKVGTLDGTATATISGTVAAAVDCSGTASVDSAWPALADPVQTDYGVGGTSITIPPFDPDSCLEPADPFTDVLSTSFARADITCIFNLGITTGTSPTTYNPGGFVSREEMAAFIARTWRTLGGVCPTTPHGFVDVPESSFAAADIDCIKGLGITTGTSPTTYNPGGFVSREEMAAFIARTWRAAIAEDLGS